MFELTREDLKCFWENLSQRKILITSPERSTAREHLYPWSGASVLCTWGTAGQPGGQGGLVNLAMSGRSCFSTSLFGLLPCSLSPTARAGILPPKTGHIPASVELLDSLLEKGHPSTLSSTLSPRSFLKSSHTLA